MTGKRGEICGDDFTLTLLLLLRCSVGAGETWSCKIVAILSLVPFVQDCTFIWDYSSVGGCDEN